MDNVVVEKCLYTELPTRWQMVATANAIATIEDATIEFCGKKVCLKGDSEEVAEYLDDHIFWVEEDRFGRQTLCKEGRW